MSGVTLGPVPANPALPAEALAPLAEVAAPGPLGLAERLLGTQAVPATLAPLQAPQAEHAGPTPGRPVLPGEAGPQLQGLAQTLRPPVAPATAEPAVNNIALAADASAPAATASAALASAATPLSPQVQSQLQVDPGLLWTLPRRPLDTPRAAPGAHWAEQPWWPDDSPPQHDTATPPTDDEPEADLEWQDATPEPDWCPALAQALGRLLAATTPPAAVLAAAEQWRQGRCVVLACPQGEDPTGPAWAHVLWPRARGRRRRAERQGVALPALHGVRVEAQLQWAGLPPQGWCHARAVKQHHPRQGRQLVALPDAAGAEPAVAPCQVQLGPVASPTARWQWACVRVLAVRPFWAALGAQWSAHVVVGSRPLVAAQQTFQEAPC